MTMRKLLRINYNDFDTGETDEINYDEYSHCDKT